MSNKLLFPILAASFFINAAAFGNADPSSALVTVYGVAISKNTDCSNASVIGYNSAGTVLDFTKGPSITNAGIVDPGTYPCVILYMSNVITFVPAASVGTACVAGTTYSRAVCAGINCQFTSATPNASNVLVYGGLQTPLASSSQDTGNPDKVLLFLSTASTGTGSNNNIPFQQPTAANWNNGLNLSSPFVVADAGGAGTFVVNFNGQIKDAGGGVCDLGAPTFGFR